MKLVFLKQHMLTWGRRILASIMLCVLLLTVFPCQAEAADDSLPEWLAILMDRMGIGDGTFGEAIGSGAGAAAAAASDALETAQYMGKYNAIADALTGDGVQLKTETISTTHTYTVNDILNRAADKFGKPYVHAKSGPDSFDCSGFVAWLFQPSGVYTRGGYKAKYPNDVAIYRDNYSRVGVKISIKDLKPGDVVVYGGHVGIYVGNNIMINALGGYNDETGISHGEVKLNYISDKLAKKNRDGSTKKTEQRVGTKKTFSCAAPFSGTPKHGVRMYGQEFSDIIVKNAHITGIQVHSASYTDDKAVAIIRLLGKSYCVYADADVVVQYGSATLKQGSKKDYTYKFNITLDPKYERDYVLGKKPIGMLTVTGVNHYKGVSAKVELYLPQLSADNAAAPPAVTAPPKTPAPTAAPTATHTPAPVQVRPQSDPVPISGFPECLLDFTKLNYGQIRQLDWVGGLYTDRVGGNGPGSWVFSANYASDTQDIQITCIFPGEFEDDSEYPCSVSVRDYKGGQSYYSLDGSSSTGYTSFDFGVGDTSKMTAIPGLTNTAYAEFPMDDGWILKVIFSDPDGDMGMPVMLTEAEIYRP